jgi:hypothetical protein
MINLLVVEPPTLATKPSQMVGGACPLYAWVLQADGGSQWLSSSMFVSSQAMC